MIAQQHSSLCDQEGIPKERVDPTVLRLVARLFPEQGLEMLALLCRRAVDKQYSLFQDQGEAHVAVITFHGILDLVTSPGWKWGPETTLKLLQVMEALTILVRFRRRGHSEIHIPLGSRPLHQSQMLKNLETCAYRNKKTRQLVNRVKNDLQSDRGQTTGQETSALSDRPELGLLIHDLLSTLKDEGVSPATRKRIALRFSTVLLQRTLSDLVDGSASQQGDSGTPESPCFFVSVHQRAILCHTITGKGTAPAFSQGDSDTASIGVSSSCDVATIEKALPATAPALMQGDSEGFSVHAGRFFQKNRPTSIQFAPSHGQTLLNVGDTGSGVRDEGDEVRPESPSSFPSTACQQTVFAGNRPVATATAAESPSTLPTATGEGDSARPSRIDYVSLQKASFRREVDLEGGLLVSSALIEAPWTLSSEELEAAACTFIRLLDGADYATSAYLATHAGKRLLGGYKNKLRHSPRLARVSLINTLLQLHFHETTKHKPLQNPGKWFHQSFNRYVDPDHPMEITGELTSWADSPYTLEEIAIALELERHRQEHEGVWKGVVLHQPFAACVTRYDLLAQHVGKTEDVDAAMLVHTVQETLPTHQESDQGVVEHEEDGGSGEPDLTIARGNEAVLQENVQEVIEVTDPTLGWETQGHVDLLWWLDQLQQTRLLTGCQFEVLPTQYGRYVLIVTPLSDPTAAWMWGTGREVRQYLQAQRPNMQH